MELAAILLIPAVASLLSLAPTGRRLAAPVTLIAASAVFALVVHVGVETVAKGRVEIPGGSLSCDGLGALVLLLVAFVALTAALYSWGYIGRRIAHAGEAKERHYYSLYNLFVLSMLAVPMLANVALMWVAVELTSLLSAFLVGFEDTAEALEAAWKYVVLTTLGAVLALLGFLILYWGSQRRRLEPFTWVGWSSAAPRMPPALLWPAFLFILVGFGTKVGLVPMHTWLPDAHSQAPASICALLSGVETTTVLYVILRLFPVVGGGARARRATLVHRLWPAVGCRCDAASDPGPGLQANVRILDGRTYGDHPGRRRARRRGSPSRAAYQMAGTRSPNRFASSRRA